MSSGTRSKDDRPRVSITKLADMKAEGEPITMVTAYDFPSAQVVEEVGVDVVLVGDSAANCVLGYDSTVPVGMEEMIMLAAAMRRGLRTPPPTRRSRSPRMRSGSIRPAASRSSSKRCRKLFRR